MHLKKIVQSHDQLDIPGGVITFYTQPKLIEFQLPNTFAQEGRGEWIVSSQSSPKRLGRRITLIHHGQTAQRADFDFIMLGFASVSCRR